jgi:hypothetical protein
MGDCFCAWRIGKIHVRPVLCKRCLFAEVDFLSWLVENSVACAAVAVPVEKWAKIQNCQLLAPLPLIIFAGVVAVVSFAIILLAAVLATVVYIDTGAALFRHNGPIVIIRILHSHISCRLLGRAKE